jgi:predicted transposase YbfD/YdcC
MVVSAYHVQERRILAQQGALSRGKEKQTALQILEHLSIAGHVLSADALHTTPHWCQQVRQKQAHYLLIAKRNRQELYDDIALLFADGPFPDLPEQQAQTIDKGHGRLEIRRLRISSALTDYLKPGWPDVAQVFQVQRLITRCGHATDELAYGFTSLSAAQASPPQVLQLVRRHWHIENILHCRRDVTLGEDACLVAQGQTPRILALLNNTVLFLVDRAGGAGNAAAKIREFAASPQSALDLILHPP